MIKVAITGGIGSGKTTLCQHFAQSGVAIYDSDRRAKELMSSDEKLRQLIIELLGHEAYTPMGLNREYIAQKIFDNEELRMSLNAIVHPAVLADFERAAAAQGDVAYVIFESAILFEAQLEQHFDYTVAVLAPQELRLSRVVTRDGCTIQQAQARIDSQLSDDELHARASFTVVNIFEGDLEGAAQRLDQQFKSLARKREESPVC
ncbi:MAG: dephospho-CoA kinase [Rikenellaceae bacterium]